MAIGLTALRNTVRESCVCHLLGSSPLIASLHYLHYNHRLRCSHCSPQTFYLPKGSCFDATTHVLCVLTCIIARRCATAALSTRLCLHYSSPASYLKLQPDCCTTYSAHMLQYLHYNPHVALFTLLHTCQAGLLSMQSAKSPFYIGCPKGLPTPDPIHCTTCPSGHTLPYFQYNVWHC